MEQEENGMNNEESVGHEDKEKRLRAKLKLAKNTLKELKKMIENGQGGLGLKIVEEALKKLEKK